MNKMKRTFADDHEEFCSRIGYIRGYIKAIDDVISFLKQRDKDLIKEIKKLKNEI